MRSPSISFGVLVFGLVFSGLFLSCEDPPDATTFTVTFDTQGGSAVKPQKVEKGKKAAKPNGPTRDGYTFAGWYKDAGGSQAFDFAVETITGDITLYAKWEETAFTVTFDTQGGSAVKPQKVEKGKKAAKPNAPTRDGYAFVGWYKDAGGSQAFDFAVETFTGDITLYAKWDKTAFTVTFEVNGGTAVAAQVIAKGSRLKVPSPPKKGKFDLLAWYTDRALTQVFNVKDLVTSDTRLYAKYGFRVPDDNFRKKLQTLVPAAFIGEVLDTAMTGLDSLDVSKSEINSLSGIEYFTALTELYCHSNTLTSLDVSKNTALKYLYCYSNTLTSLDVSKNTVLRSLYCYSNALTSLDVSKNTDLGILSCYSNSLTALDLRGMRFYFLLSIATGSGGKSLLTELKVHEELKNANEVKAAKAKRDTALTIKTYSASAGSTTYTLTCNDYDPTANSGAGSCIAATSTVKVTFESNGGTAVAAQVIAKGSKLKVLSPPKKGKFDLLAWYTDRALKTPFDVNSPVTTNTTLYAKYGFRVPDDNFRKKLQTLVPSAFIGEVLDTAHTAVTGRTSIEVRSLKINSLTGIEYFTALTELYCHFNSLTSLDVSKNTALRDLDCSFNSLTSLDVSKNTALAILNCSSNSLTSLDVSKNTALTSLYCSFNSLTALDLRGMRSVTGLSIATGSGGKNLLTELKVHEALKNVSGVKATKRTWGTALTIKTYSASAGSTTYTPTCNDYDPTANSGAGSCIASTSTVKVTFESNGGIPTPSSQTVKEGTKATKPADPTRSGYRFVGWYTDTTSSQAFDFDTTRIRANITLYAKWVQVVVASYTVTFESNGGTVVAAQVIASGSRLKVPSPKKGKFDLLAWYTDRALKTPFDVNSSVTTNITLYAKYGFRVPDDNFRNKLKALVPAAFIGEVLDTAHTAVTGRTSLDVQSSKITSLTGIEYFTALMYLDCSLNSLTSLDVSKNTALTSFACYSNALTALDVSKNTALAYLNCHSNALTALDVSKNTALTELYCDSNALTVLDIRGMRSVTNLSIATGSGGKNLLTDLKVHDALKNHAEVKAAKGNRGTALTIKTYSASAGSTTYTPTCNDYDPTANSGAGSCIAAATSTVKVTFESNGGTVVAAQVIASGSRLKVPSPKKGKFDLLAWYTDMALKTPFDVNGPVTANTTLYAKYGFRVPDDNFRNKLKALVRAAFIGEVLDTAHTAVTGRTSLDVQSSKITSLTGIEYFTALTRLVCNDNSLTSLDVSNNTALTGLYCYSNALTVLDVSNNTALAYLNCYSNALTALDVSKNTALTSLYCSFNSLTALDLRGMRSVTGLSIATGSGGKNLLTDLKVHDALKNHAEVKVAKGNRGTALTIKTYSASAGSTTYTPTCNNYDPLANSGAGSCIAGTSTVKVTFESNGGTVVAAQVIASGSRPKVPSPKKGKFDLLAWYTDMALKTPFDVNSSVTTNITLYAKYGFRVPDDNFRKKLQTLIPAAFTGEVLDTAHTAVTGRTSLDVQSSKITSLTGIEYFTALTSLSCLNNKLTALDVSKNTALTTLYCHSNSLTSLDVSKNTALTQLNCEGNNQLTALDVSGATALRELYCNSNSLTSLDVSKNTALTSFACYSNALTALDVSKNTALAYLNCHSNALTALDVSKNTALTELYCDSNALTVLDIRGMRSVTNLSIATGSGGKNLLTDLKVHDALKNHAEVKVAKGNRKEKITIKTYSASAGSTTYTPTCNDYDPLANSGAGSCIAGTSTVTVTFESNGGTVVAAQVIASGSRLKVPSPKKGKFDLLAWYTDRALKTPFDVNSSVTTNITLYAKYGFRVPDDNFRNNLKALIPAAFIGEVLDTAHTAVTGRTSLNVLSSKITSLTGIEYFTALMYLDCSLNSLTSLDVSKNTALTSFACYSTSLTSLDVSKNTALTRLNCGRNNLTSLDASKNTALTSLSCLNNKLTALDVSKNTALTTLYCQENSLTSLDVSKNTALTQLNCEGNNQLTALDVSGATALRELYCNSNSLTSLDVSKNTSLTSLNCSGNKLTSLDVSKNTMLTDLYCDSNSLTVLDIRGMRSVTSLSIPTGFEGRNLLTELKVHDALKNHAKVKEAKGSRGTAFTIKTYSASAGSTAYTVTCNDYDPTANSGAGSCIASTSTVTVTFEVNGGTVLAAQVIAKGSTLKVPSPKKGKFDLLAWYTDMSLKTPFDVNSSVTTDITLYAKYGFRVPDDNFRNKLKALIPAAFIGEVLDTAHTAVTGRTSLNVRRSRITSLNGIEYFTALTELDCDYNTLTSLDVSKNTALTDLDCSLNSLTSLDVSKNTALTELNCRSNKLTALDVPTNTALTRLSCHNNKLTTLDVSKNTALTRLSCHNNKLTTLDVSKNTALTHLSCQDNSLTALDVSKNTMLTILSCNSNGLTSLDVSKNTALTLLGCHSNTLTSLDVSTNTALTMLDCNNNKLMALDVSKNTALTYLNCIFTSLTVLDVSNNTALMQLYCNNTSLTALDVSKNTALTQLYCNNTSLTSLDVSKNTALTQLFCNSNSLTVLDVSNNTALTTLYCQENSLTSLDVSGATALTLLDCDSNSLTSLDVSGATALTLLDCNSNTLTSLDVSKNTTLTQLYCYSNSLTGLDIRGMRSVRTLFIATGSGNKNLLTELKVHDALKNHAKVKAAKRNRGAALTIKTYSASAGSTSYTPTCNNYDPFANSGAGSCTENP